MRRLYYIVKQYINYYLLYTPFALQMDLFGISPSYHFEIDVKSKELVVEGSSLRIFNNKLRKYSIFRIDKFFGVVKSSTPFIKTSTYHLYTTKARKIEYNGASVDPRELSLIIWVKTGLLNFAIFGSILLLELFLLFIGDSLFSKGDSIPYAFFGVLVTLSLVYRPDIVTELIMRKWKRRVWIGGILFVLGYGLNYLVKRFPDARLYYNYLQVCELMQWKKSFYHWLLWGFFIYLFLDIFIFPIAKKMDLLKKCT